MGEMALAVGMPKVAAPPGWKWVALTDVARLESGHTPSRKHREYWGGEVPWLSIRDAKAHHAGTIHDTIEHTNELGIANSSARILPAGTVCLSRTASVGYVVIMGRSMATSQDFVNWVCSKQLEPRFLQYLLIFEGPSLTRFSSGAVHQTIYFPEVKAFHVCLPPLEEQRRIVAVLDEAFTAIATATANAEKNLANARELFSSELRHLFHVTGAAWDWKPIGDVAEARLGKMLDKAKNRGVPQPYLRNLNVRWFGFNLANLLEMPFEESETERYTARRGDLLIVEGGYPGRAAIWDRDEPIFFQKAVHRVRFDDPRLARLLMYMLFAQDGDGALSKHFSGAGIQHLTGQALARITMPIPPWEMRDKIVSKIETMLAVSEDAQRLYETKLNELAKLKQSLLHRAFSGELTERRVLASAPANDNYTTPEFSAQVLAFAHSRHVALGRTTNFGHVKAQKTLHAVEAIGRLDLGRQPIRDAAGPNDFAHMRQAENWARQQGFFEFVQRANGGYDFHRLANYDTLLDEAKQRLEQAGATAKRAVELLVDMDSDFAEIVMTTHAAWNNLILDEATITDDAIVHSARDDWHRDKLRHDKSRFHDAIRFIRAKGIEPDGSAKRVGGQETLPL
jgi:type I restriction enzyme S subunit